MEDKVDKSESKQEKKEKKTKKLAADHEYVCLAHARLGAKKVSTSVSPVPLNSILAVVFSLDLCCCFAFTVGSQQGPHQIPTTILSYYESTPGRFEEKREEEKRKGCTNSGKVIPVGLQLHMTARCTDKLLA